MVEKYREIIPRGSIWFSLSRKETIALLEHQGELENMSSSQIDSINGSDLQGENVIT